ncbi:MAG: hypothetical protein LQ337_000736 [Flavoplaca oasis]|nr:MAG: hypothetical protein LQ337_000736 [Flavoplaca oasis]
MLHIADGKDRDLDNGPWIGRRGLNFVKRSGRTKCGKTIGVAALIDNSVGGGYPSDYDPSKTRRDILPTKRNLVPFPVTAYNALAKRILPEFPPVKAAQDTFMREQVELAATDVVPDPVNDEDINSGQFRKIGGTDYTKDSVTLGLGRKKDERNRPQRLKGCTALIVMSEKAVWFGHLWETLSYDGPHEVFQSTVIDFINNGGTENPEEQQSLKAHSEDFKGQKGTSAWILYPVGDDVEEDDGTKKFVYYKDKNTRLQEEVFKLTGIMATMTEYTPSEETELALGRALYQYSPLARDADPDKPDQPVRGFRFIHEYKNEGIHFF